MRILVVDGHMLFAEALRFALQAKGMSAVHLATTGREAIELAETHEPDVVLVDLGLPDMDGLEVGRTILESHSGTIVVAVTPMHDLTAVRKVIASGFHGYVTKDTPLDKFVKIIESALDGEIVIPRSIAPRVAGHQTPEERRLALVVDQLTSREKEVLALLANGAGSREIALELRVSFNTVRSHVQNILTKLQVHSRLEAAAFAVRHGVVEVARHRAQVG